MCILGARNTRSCAADFGNRPCGQYLLQPNDYRKTSAKHCTHDQNGVAQGPALWVGSSLCRLSAVDLSEGKLCDVGMGVGYDSVVWEKNLFGKAWCRSPYISMLSSQLLGECQIR